MLEIADGLSMLSVAGNFETASGEVLRFLQQRLGFSQWLITRVAGDDQIILQTQGHLDDAGVNAVFRWSDTFCTRMVGGFGPRFAPDCAAVPAYAEAPLAREFKIGAYLGVPLTYGEGSLFGTLCATDPDPQPEAIGKDLPLVELLAGVLSRLLETELGGLEAARHAERARAEADTDALTDLYNRRGWNRLLEAEDTRCRRYGEPASVVAIDLDGLKSVNDLRGHKAGDELICRAARAIRTASRRSDLAARLGGDEFAVLCAQSTAAESEALALRLRDALADAEVCASLGMASRVPSKGLRYACEEADRAMYLEKAAKRLESARPAPILLRA